MIMLIHLTHSRLFTEDPATRFATVYGVERELWVEMWRRKQLLDYTLEDLCDYFELKTHRKLKHQSLRRWLFRAEIYSISAALMKRGVRVVQSEFFRKHEQAVLYEITKGIRSGEAKSTKSIV